MEVGFDFRNKKKQKKGHFSRRWIFMWTRQSEVFVRSQVTIKQIIHVEVEDKDELKRLTGRRRGVLCTLWACGAADGRRRSAGPPAT